MALNLATFRTRALTAIVFVIVMLAGLFGGKYAFFLLFSVVHFGCWIEYQRLLDRIDPDYKAISPIHRYGIMLAGWCIMLNFTNDDFLFLGIRFHALGWFIGLPILLIFPIMELLLARTLHLKNFGYSLLGLIYISLSWGLLVDLYVTPHNLVGNAMTGAMPDYLLPIVMIASIWINDTMAYIVGSLIGKTPFSKISPKKTWEGTAGGALLAVVVVTATMYYISGRQLLLFWAGISLISAVMGTVGDLLESKLKRMADVKDSGSIMPGHGGFLDRFDSLLLATPFVWLFITIVYHA